MELSKAAYSHCNDIGHKGLTGHTGSDNSNISDRIEKHLERNGSIAECITYEHENPLQMPNGHQIPNFDEMPEGAVGANTYIKTYPMNGATMVEETKVFTFRDGSTQTMTRTYQE